MTIETCIDSLVSYAMNCGLTQPEDHIVVVNRLSEETGKVFSDVLEDAGVYKCDEAGRAAFMRFVDAVNA